jgi:hypothetical protein
VELVLSQGVARHLDECEIELRKRVGKWRMRERGTLKYKYKGKLMKFDEL